MRIDDKVRLHLSSCSCILNSDAQICLALLIISLLLQQPSITIRKRVSSTGKHVNQVHIHTTAMPALYILVPSNIDHHPAMSTIITAGPIITERRASGVAIRARRIGTIGWKHLIREIGLHQAVIVDPLDTAVTRIGITRRQHILQTVVRVSKTILASHELRNSRFVNLPRGDWIVVVDRRVGRAIGTLRFLSLSRTLWHTEEWQY